MSQGSVKSLMNPRVISVLPETSVLVAIDIVLANNFSGVPVTDKNGVLVGILTKYDLINQRNSLRDDTSVGDVMNTDPLVLNENDSVENAARAFSEHHKVDPIPVVNENRRVVGVISRHDMVKMFREHRIPFASDPKKQLPSAVTKAPVLLRLYVIILAVLAVATYLLLR